MERILIPMKRAELLKKNAAMVNRLSERLRCRIEVVDENIVSIEGEAIDEFNAKSVILAFGRGFNIGTALRLLNDSYIFESISLKEITKNKKREAELKSRVIGTRGRAKEYIEQVSGVSMCIYGGTVSFIGTPEEIKVARAAVDTLLFGGTHKNAYRVMEAAKRKMMR